MKKKILVLNLLFCALSLFAQQDPQYTQYMYNMNVINPAYATGEQSLLKLGSLYRTQWVGAVGSPKTLTAFGHFSLNKKMEIGLSAISDEVGSVVTKKENNFYADFAYVLQVGDNEKLSLGVKAGVTTFNTNFTDAKLNSGNASTDPAFSENINQVLPNAGVGAFYFTNKFYLGLSIPNLLSSKHLEEKNGVKFRGSENIHTFFTGGYVFNLSDTFKLKPAFMTKFVAGAPLELDVTANVMYNDRFEMGVGYRVKDAVSGLVNVRVFPFARIGYAYDYTLSNLGNFNSGTHEVMLLFDLDFLSRGYDKSPRFF
jgi:type IX secretion system PorP/SprF family membrane protein